jgi:tight adherence protein B
MTLFIGALVFTFVLIVAYRPAPFAISASFRLPHPTWLPRRSRNLRQAELAWIDALIGELTVGRDPVSALVTACECQDVPVAHEGYVAARTGGDVSAALIVHRSEVVRSVGACWLVASTSGAGLVAALTSIADSARDQERILQGVEVAVAEPKAAAAVVAALPIVGLGMGSMLGSSPLGWLVGTGLGRAILVVAIALELVGCWWSLRIIRAVADSP